MPMPTTPTAYPDVATREEWLEARTKLLAREREVTHLRDAVNVDRRGQQRLPELHDGRKPHVHGEGPRAAEREGRDVRCGVASAVCEHRALQGRARLDVPVVLVAR